MIAFHGNCVTEGHAASHCVTGFIADCSTRLFFRLRRDLFPGRRTASFLEHGVDAGDGCGHVGVAMTLVDEARTPGLGPDPERIDRLLAPLFPGR